MSSHRLVGAILSRVLSGIVLTFLLFIPGAQLANAQQAVSSLQGLRVVAILAERPSEGAMLDGITQRVLQDQALVYLRTKIPQLRIDATALPYVYIHLNYLESDASYAADLHVSLVRPVEVLIGVNYGQEQPSRRVRTGATVWDKSFIMRGSRREALGRIRETLELLLEQFTAEYFRANQ